MGSMIHNTAIVEKGAKIGKNCKIGPFCIVGANVELADNVVLHSHVVIDGYTKIGSGSIVFPFACLGQMPQDLKYKNEISYLEIGCNTTIREYVTASLGTEGGGLYTKIGDNCLIMAYCHIAHDCCIGNNVILSNCVQLAGHVVVGDYAIVGGVTAVKQFVRIGNHAIIGGFSSLDCDVVPFSSVKCLRSATIRGINIIGLKRRGFDAEEISQIMEAFEVLFGDDSEIMNNRVAKLREKYSSNANISEIIKFVEKTGKNPLCTRKILKQD